MRSNILAVLLVVCCNSPTDQDNGNTELKKCGLIVTYSQHIRINPLRGDNCTVDPCAWAIPMHIIEIDSLRAHRIKTFVIDSMIDNGTVFLSQQIGNYCAVADPGGSVYHTSISNIPFLYKATNHANIDSCAIIIDSITSSLCIKGTIGTHTFNLHIGDSLIYIDTLIAQRDSIHCPQQQIITRCISNRGFDSLPNSNYDHFF